MVVWAFNPLKKKQKLKIVKIDFRKSKNQYHG